MHPNDRERPELSPWVQRPLGRGGSSVANQADGNHGTADLGMFAVLSSCGMGCLLFVPTLQIPPFLHNPYSDKTSWDRPAWAVPCSVKSWRQCQGSATFSGVAVEQRAQMLSAVQWEGRLVTCLRVLSLASLTASVLRSAFLFVRTAIQQEAVTCRIITFLFS